MPSPVVKGAGGCPASPAIVVILNDSEEALKAVAKIKPQNPPNRQVYVFITEMLLSVDFGQEPIVLRHAFNIIEQKCRINVKQRDPNCTPVLQFSATCYVDFTWRFLTAG